MLSWIATRQHKMAQDNTLNYIIANGLRCSDIILDQTNKAVLHAASTRVYRYQEARVTQIKLYYTLQSHVFTGNSAHSGIRTGTSRSCPRGLHSHLGHSFSWCVVYLLAYNGMTHRTRLIETPRLTCILSVLNACLHGSPDWG